MCWQAAAVPAGHGGGAGFTWCACPRPLPPPVHRGPCISFEDAVSLKKLEAGSIGEALLHDYVPASGLISALPKGGVPHDTGILLLGGAVRAVSGAEY